MSKQNGGVKESKQMSIDEILPHDLEKLYEEINQILKTGRGYYLSVDPKQPLVYSIISVFSSCKDVKQSNLFREAIFLCLERERFKIDNKDYFLNLLHLIREIRVEKTVNILFHILYSKNIGKLTIETSDQLKPKIIAALLEFDLSSEKHMKALREIINSYIRNPQYTEICLQATLQYLPITELFLEYFPIAFEIYKNNRDMIHLPIIFWYFLIKVGKYNFEKIGLKLLLSILNDLTIFWNMLEKLELNPLIIDKNDITGYEYEEMTSLYEIFFNLPNSKEIAYIEIPTNILTDTQKDIINNKIDQLADHLLNKPSNSKKNSFQEIYMLSENPILNT